MRSDCIGLRSRWRERSLNLALKGIEPKILIVKYAIWGNSRSEANWMHAQGLWLRIVPECVASTSALTRRAIKSILSAAALPVAADYTRQESKYRGTRD